MLMIEDLKQRNLMDKLLSEILRNRFKPIISNGMLCANCIETDRRYFSTLFKNAQLVFAGVSHSNILGPIFALEVGKDNIAILNEYHVSERNVKEYDKKLVENDLTSLAVAISFFYSEIKKVKIPTEIHDYNNQICNVSHSYDSCFLNIK